MFVIKIDQVLEVQTLKAKDSERTFKKWKLLCDNPYFDAKTGVHSSKRVVYAVSSNSFEIKKSKSSNFVFVTQSKRGLWLNGQAN